MWFFQANPTKDTQVKKVYHFRVINMFSCIIHGLSNMNTGFAKFPSISNRFVCLIGRKANQYCFKFYLVVSTWNSLELDTIDGAGHWLVS